MGEVIDATNGVQHTVKCSDVTAVKRGDCIVEYVVILRSYKHSGGNVKTIRVTQKTPGVICPVLALTKYLLLRPPVSEYLFIHDNGRGVCDTWVTSVIKQLLRVINVDPTHYSSHSLRIGAATDLVQAGASDAQLRVFGRWSSNAGARYVRPGENVV